MSRRHLYSMSVMVLLGTCGVLFLNMGPLPAATVSDKPNIIFILVDDFAASDMAYLPKLKSLMTDMGTSFNHYYTPNALCCPSRSTTLRGQFSHNHGVKTNDAPDGGYEKFYNEGSENSTIATWLQSSGYKTVLMGKYLNGYPRRDRPLHVPPGWSEWYAGVGVGYYDGYNYNLNENGTKVPYGDLETEYLTDVLRDKSVKFIKESTSTPFFMYIAPTAPHAPAKAATRHVGVFKDLPLVKSPAFSEEDVSDKPLWIRNLPPVKLWVQAIIRANFRMRLQSMLAVEDLLESILNTLQEQNLLDKTYIFFASDNGWLYGEHRIASGKSLVYDEAVRVPLVVRGPGVPVGQKIDHFGCNQDLAPTWAELAGVSMPDFIDGKSLVPLLRADRPDVDAWRKRVLLEHWFASEEPGDGRPDAWAVRSHQYKYIESGTGERELYNMQNDPYEMNSLHADPAYAEVMDQLKSQLDALKPCRGQDCVRLETE